MAAAIITAAIIVAAVAMAAAVVTAAADATEAAATTAANTAARPMAMATTAALRSPPTAGRSEERRVGKECRGWWSPRQEKKKHVQRIRIEDQDCLWSE